MNTFSSSNENTQTDCFTTKTRIECWKQLWPSVPTYIEYNDISNIKITTSGNLNTFIIIENQNECTLEYYSVYNDIFITQQKVQSWFKLWNHIPENNDNYQVHSTFEINENRIESWYDLWYKPKYNHHYMVQNLMLLTTLIYLMLNIKNDHLNIKNNETSQTKDENDTTNTDFNYNTFNNLMNRQSHLINPFTLRKCDRLDKFKTWKILWSQTYQTDVFITHKRIKVWKGLWYKSRYKYSKKRWNKYMHTLNGNIHRFTKFVYPFMNQNITHVDKIHIHEKQIEAYCLKHALNNMFYKKNFITIDDLEKSINELTQPPWKIDKCELKNVQGNYVWDVGSNLLLNRNYQIIMLKNDYDYTLCLPSFRGNENFIGCIVQQGSVNYGHYTCIYHQQQTNKIFLIDSVGEINEITSMKDIQYLLQYKKVFAIFKNKNENHFDDCLKQYCINNLNDSIYQKMVIDYYINEHKEYFYLNNVEQNTTYIRLGKQLIHKLINEYKIPQKLIITSLQHKFPNIQLQIYDIFQPILHNNMFDILLSDDPYGEIISPLSSTKKRKSTSRQNQSRKRLKKSKRTKKRKQTKQIISFSKKQKPEWIDINKATRKQLKLLNLSQREINNIKKYQPNVTIDIIFTDIKITETKIKSWNKYHVKINNQFVTLNYIDLLTSDINYIVNQLLISKKLILKFRKTYKTYQDDTNSLIKIHQNIMELMNDNNISNWNNCKIFVGPILLNTLMIWTKKNLQLDLLQSPRSILYEKLSFTIQTLKAFRKKCKNKSMSEIEQLIQNELSIHNYEQWLKYTIVVKSKIIDINNLWKSSKTNIKYVENHYNETWNNPKNSVRECSNLSNLKTCTEETKKHEQYLNELQLHQCTCCNDTRIRHKNEIKNNLCVRCFKLKTKHKFNPYSITNFGTLTPIPKYLPKLNSIEIQLISRSCLILKVIRLPGGQLGYKGHTICIYQDVQKLADVLPRLPSEIESFVVTKPGEKLDKNQFSVNRNKIEQWLTYLCANNEAYKNKVTISKNRLKQLPNGKIPDSLRKSYEINKNDECQLKYQNTGPVNQHDIILEETSSSFIPKLTDFRNENEKIILHFRDGTKTTAHWTPQGSPVSEFENYLYSACFPCLFHNSKGDPTAPQSNIIKPLSWKEHIHHLLRYSFKKDNNTYSFPFEEHPTFAYTAANKYFRNTTMKSAKMYIKQDSFGKTLTTSKLRSIIKNGNDSEKKQLLEKIIHWNKNIRISGEYWKNQQKELRAITESGIEWTLFDSYSAADYHWKQLHQLLSGSSTLPNIKTRVKLVQKHPLIVTDFFMKKWNDYFKRLKKLLNITDYYYRFEWQSRGSIHVHCLFKLKNDPGIIKLTSLAQQSFILQEQMKNADFKCTGNETEIIKKGDDAKQTVENYYNWLITTMNPITKSDNVCDFLKHWDKPSNDNHVCTKLYSELNSDTDKIQDYIDLTNSVQRHQYCTPGYCLRRKRISKNQTEDEYEEFCRFNFPFDLTNKTELTFEKHELRDKTIKYLPIINSQRNDEYLNKHNKWSLTTWRANCDRQLLLDYQSVLKYTTKYVSKSEKPSLQMIQSLEQIELYSDNFDNVSTLINKILNKCIGLRDISKNEICFMLSNYQIHKSSKTVTNINLNLELTALIDFKNQFKQLQTTSVIDKYENRNSKYKLLSLHEYVHSINMRTNEVLSEKIQKNKVCRFTPRYPSNPKHPLYVKHCKYKLLQYQPYTNRNDILSLNDQEVITQWNKFLLHNQNKIMKNTLYDELDNASVILASIEEGQEECDIEINETHEEFVWPTYRTHSTSSHTDIKLNIETNIQKLTKPLLKYEENELIDIEKKLYQSIDFNLTTTIKKEQYNKIELSELSEKQRKVYDMLNKHVNTNSNQLLLLIMGGSGTGKTYVINNILKPILKEKVICCATTGVAAIKINGQTIHSAVSLMKKKLNSVHLTNLQSKFENVQYLIIDECSMFSHEDLHHLNERLKLIKHNDDPFGGLNIILVGHFAQLPPVGGLPMWVQPKHYDSPERHFGYLTYRLFKNVIYLNKIKRQKDTTWKNILNRICDGKITQNDWTSLSTRDPQLHSTLTNDLNYKTAVRLFAHNDKVDAYNLSQLQSLHKPIIKIEGMHNNETAKSFKPDKFWGLKNTLYLCENAQVMLRINISSEFHLVNGTIGYIKDILFDLKSPTPNLPICLIIEFKNYTGPQFFKNPLYKNYVPIGLRSINYFHNNTIYTRTNFPITLSWARTIHKSQGETIDNAVIDIGDSDIGVGSTYVALSRVPNFENIYIKGKPWIRYQKINNNKRIQNRIREERRLKTLE